MENKENIKDIIAANLVELRKSKKMTQSEVAEKLNYSDKAISRWEHADSLPDIETLCKVCEIYGVKFEYLLQKEQPKKNNPYIVKSNISNSVLITIIAAATVWIAALVVYMCMNTILEKNIWELFIWAIPVTAAVCGACNRLFFQSRVFKYIAMSIMMWTLLLAFYVNLIEYNIWMLFITGVPIQTVIMLLAFLKTGSRQK